jgi:hypothetical protein
VARECRFDPTVVGYEMTQLYIDYCSFFDEIRVPAVSHKHREGDVDVRRRVRNLNGTTSGDTFITLTALSSKDIHTSSES